MNVQYYANSSSIGINNSQHYVLRLLSDIADVSTTEESTKLCDHTSPSPYTSSYTRIVYCQIIITAIRGMYHDGWFFFMQIPLIGAGLSWTGLLLLSKIWVGTAELMSPFQMWPLGLFHGLTAIRFQLFWWQGLGYSDDLKHISKIAHLWPWFFSNSLLIIWRYCCGRLFDPDMQLMLRHPVLKHEFVSRRTWKHLWVTFCIVSSFMGLGLYSVGGGLEIRLGTFLIWMCPMILWFR